MKTRYQVLISLLLGICLIVVGVSMGGRLVGDENSLINNIDIRWDKASIENQVQEFNNVDELELNISYANVNIYEEESQSQQRIRVVATHLYDGFHMEKSGDTLMIEQDHDILRKKNQGLSQIDIYVPKDYIFDKVDVDSSMGQSTISNVKTYDFDFDGAAEMMGIYRLECYDELNIDNAMGKVDVTLKEMSRYDYKVSNFLGKVNVDGVTSYVFSHDTHEEGHRAMIDIDCFAGVVDVRMEDDYYEQKII